MKQYQPAPRYLLPRFATVPKKPKQQMNFAQLINMIYQNELHHKLTLRQI